MANGERMKSSLNLLVLRCRNIDVSKIFYEKLGFLFEEERHGKGPRHFAAEMNEIVFELYPLAEGETVDRSRLGFTMEVPDLAQLLQTKEIDVVSSYNFNNRLVFVVQDPDARKIELCQGQP